MRPPNTILFAAIGAGAGAAIGSIAGGGAIFAGIGGGLGVVVGYLILSLRIRGSGQSIAMALVLEDDHVDLLRLGLLGTKPSGTYRSIPDADITGIEARNRLALEVRILVHTTQGTVTLDGGRRGVGAAPPVIDELRRRIAGADF